MVTDVSSVYLDCLRNRFSLRPNVRIGYLDLNDIPIEEFRRLELDTAVCLNVLEHIERDLLALHRLHEVLATGGKLILLVPAHQVLYSSLDRELGHYRRYSHRHLRQKLEAAGFQVLDLRHFNAPGILDWMVNWHLLRRKALPSLQVRLYNLLVPLFKIERFFRLPFGLSLIALAETRGSARAWAPAPRPTVSGQ